MVFEFKTKIDDTLVNDYARLANAVIDETHATDIIEKLDFDSAYDLLEKNIQKHSALLTVYEGKKLIGTGLMSPVRHKMSKHYCEISKVMVDPSARRQGVGKKIMQMLEEKAKEMAYTHVILDTWDISFILEFYELCGYNRIGKIPNYVDYEQNTLDSYILFKLL